MLAILEYWAFSSKVWSEERIVFVHLTAVNMKGRAIAQAFLPFPRTHAPVVLGFSQKSLAIKALKTNKQKIHAYLSL